MLCHDGHIIAARTTLMQQSEGEVVELRIQWGSFEPLKINQHMMICLVIFIPDERVPSGGKRQKEVSKGKK